MVKNIIDKMKKETPNAFYERMFGETGEPGSGIMGVVSRLTQEEYLSGFL